MENVTPRRSLAAMYVTMAVSAIWHGYYIAYYIFFLQIAFYNQIGRMFYSTNWSWLPGSGVLRYIVMAEMLITLNYVGE
jgi:hypothetical protein